jgi:CheY-like chemotaxis protein
MMDGTITVKSTPEVGSVFTVGFLFKTLSDSNTDNEKKDLLLQDVSENAKFLLVEDDKTSQFLMTKISKMLNWNLSIVSSGMEALSFLQNNEVDIILMDIQMPEMSGIKVTKKIRVADNPLLKDVIIIGTSAYAMEEDIKEALDAGMDAYLCKPINYLELNQLIIKYLNKNRK